MQGILSSHFKQVKKYLLDLQQVEVLKSSCNHNALIEEHENRLSEIYDNYKKALSNIEIHIKEFDAHKKSVRRLIVEHKKCKK